MSLRNSRKVLKSILARDVIFVSFAVTIVAGSAWVPKNVHAKHLSKNKCLLYKVCFNALMRAAL